MATWTSPRIEVGEACCRPGGTEDPSAGRRPTRYRTTQVACRPPELLAARYIPMLGPLDRAGRAAAEAGRVKEGQAPIGPWKRQQIARWRRAMEEAFAPVADWLP